MLSFQKLHKCYVQQTHEENVRSVEYLLDDFVLLSRSSAPLRLPIFRDYLWKMLQLEI